MNNNRSIELGNQMTEIFSSSWSNSNSPLPDVSNDSLSKNNLSPAIQDNQTHTPLPNNSNDSLSKNNLSPLIQENQRNSSNSLIQSGYLLTLMF